MNNNLKKIALAGCVALGLSASGAALATGSHDCGDGGTSNPDCYSWKFNGTSDNYGTSTKELWNSASKDSTPTAIDATATAWSDSGSAGALQSAYIGGYGGSGMGVTNQNEIGAGSPNHAIDNNGMVDSMLFSFGEAVNIDSMQVGWVSTDSDYTVMAYTGSDLPANLAGQTYSQLLGNGWSLVGTGASYYGGAGHYNGGTGYGTGSEGTRNFANDIFSSYWLIGALNAQLGANDNKDGNDYFKILALAGCDCTKTPDAVGCRETTDEVPEPGTLLLLGAGLYGLSRFNARRPLRFAA